jgi:hypothetical protein
VRREEEADWEACDEHKCKNRKPFHVGQQRQFPVQTSVFKRSARSGGPIPSRPLSCLKNFLASEWEKHVGKNAAVAVSFSLWTNRNPGGRHLAEPVDSEEQAIYL